MYDKRLSMIGDNDDQLLLLERRSQNTNNDQGLGFVVAGRVLDTKSLKTIFVGMVGFHGTVVPMIIALRPTAAVASSCTDCCAATPIELAAATKC